MKSNLLRTLAASITLSLAACSSLNPFADSGPEVAPLTDFMPTAELRSAWEARIGDSGAYVFQPAVVGDSVFAAAHDGSVARYQAGQQIWRIKVGRKLAAGVGSDGRLVVVVGTDGTAIALDAESGAERWQSAIGAEVLAAPAVDENLVVVRASDNRLIALAAADGGRKWVYQRSTPPLALRSFSGVTLEGGAALAGFPGGKLVALNLSNGGALWELTVANPRGATELERVADVAGPPVLGRREICAVTYQGRAACFDASNGNALWARDFSSTVGMDRDTRFVYITDDNDAVHALDAYSGSSVWKQDGLAGRSVTRPLALGEFVVAGDGEGYVHVLRRDDGAFAARARAGKDPIVADPHPLGDGRFLVQTKAGDLRAFEIR